MNIKQKILSAFTAHPKIAIFSIGLAITFVVGSAIGVVEPQQAFAGAKLWGG